MSTIQSQPSNTPFTFDKYESAIAVDPSICVTKVPCFVPRQWRVDRLIRVSLSLARSLLAASLRLWRLFLYPPHLLLKLCLPHRFTVFRTKAQGKSLSGWLLDMVLDFITPEGPKLPSTPMATVWWVFWTVFAMIGDKEPFQQHYTKAWWTRIGAEHTLKVAAYQNSQDSTLQPHVNVTDLCSFVMFRDNSCPLLVPCHWDMTDEQFIEHLRNFYYLQRFMDGFLAAFSLKTVSHIEVVELPHGAAAGLRKYYLDLGRYGSENRLIHFWLQPSDVQGSTIVDRLIAEGALSSAKPNTDTTQFQSSHTLGDHKTALNIVSRWSTGVSAVIVGIPIALSVLIAMFWPVVAVRVFNADVQTSIQTSFTIASYVITAGALLVAVVAFLDTQNDKISDP